MQPIRTLNELSHLKEVRFGQPHPRHGLSLLWWFADQCVERIDRKGRMIAQYDPEDGYFGFHEFHNAEELLPDTDLTYYEVGNLSPHHHHRVNELPHQVSMNYDSDDAVSNTDRIIVSVEELGNGKVCFDQVYVTQHSDEDDFSEDCTYRISQGLIRIIKNLDRSDFIRSVKIRRRRRR